MADELDRYIQFMSEEANLASMERFSSRNISSVTTLLKMVENKESIDDVKNYISKYLNELLNYAPHLTLQMLLASMAQDQMQLLQLPSFLESLISRSDIPAKSYSVINSYISILKVKETSAPNLTMASDDKIINLLENLSPKTMQNLLILIQLRLKLESNYTHMIEILNSYFMAASKDPLMKLTLLVQIYQAFNKHQDETCPFKLLLANKEYNIMFNGKVELNQDPLIRGVDYYSKENIKSDNAKILLNNTAMMFRLLNYNVSDFYNTGDKVKTFILAVCDTYNSNIMIYAPNEIVSLDIDTNLRQSQDYDDVKSLITSIFRTTFR